MTQSTFEKLRPVCVKLSKEPSNDTIRQLKDLLDSLDEGALQPLQQYVLFPLRLVLRDPQKLPTGCCESAISCINKIFSCTTLIDWQVFSDFFSTLCVLISSKTNFSKVSAHAEELKLAVALCLLALLNSVSKVVLINLYSPDYLPAVGHAVSILLGLAESEKLKELRITAMMCLQQLGQCSEGQPNVCIDEARQCFASFLPGITIALSRVMLGDPKQGQKVIITAINTWRRIVTMVMNDAYTPSQSENITSHQSSNRGLANSSGMDLLVARTQEWVESTAKKLDILIGRIVSMATNHNWKICLAMVTFSEELLFNCSRCLSSSIPKLLELLVSLVGDEYNAVATQCRIVLERFSQTRTDSDGEGKPLIELLEESLHSLATKLPRIMRTTDDAAKLATLNLLIGYLKLLGPNISSLLNSVSHLRRLSLALVQVLEFDLRDVKILEESTLQPETKASTTSFVQHCQTRRKYFKHFADDKIHKAIIQICHLLGLYGDITLLVDHFLDLFHESSSLRKQSVLILNEIMLGTMEIPVDGSNKASWEGSASPALRDTSEMEGAVRTLLQEYLLPSHWHLPTTPDQSESLPTHKAASNWLVVSGQEKDSTSLAVLNSNVLLISLLLEGIGAFARVLGSRFNLLLMDCLYPVLEKLADDKHLIGQTAYSTLVEMCLACGYQTIPLFLSANADYLVDAISLGLRHLEMNPKAPLVLKVTLQYSDADMLPLLQDTIDEIILALDEYPKDLAAMMIDVLKTLVVAIYRWFPLTDTANESQVSEPSETNKPSPRDEMTNEDNRPAKHHDPVPIQTIQDFFLEHLRMKRIAQGDVKEEDLEGAVGDELGHIPGEEVDSEMEVDKEKTLPVHIKTVKEVLERCRNFLSSNNPRLRLKVLDVVQHGILALQSYQDELLPLIHRIWPAFVQRFTDSEPLVSCRACELLRTMADTSGDFIKKRIIKDIWPRLTGFLDTHAKMSQKSGPSYRHTSTCKLQLAILECVAPICIKTGIGGRELVSMATSCLPYLSARQPEVLQTAAIQSFHEQAMLEPDAIWLTLCDVYCPESLQPPHDSFPSHKFFGEINPRRSEYAKNVQSLLDRL